MSWYLSIGEGSPQSFDALGLTRLRRTIRSQQAGSFTFTADGAGADTNPLAAEGTICTVLQGGEPFFAGRLYRIPRKGSGSAESVDYQLLDAWHDFEKNVYQQQWNTIQSLDESGAPSIAAEYRSELILGVDLNGNAMNSGQVIADIVTWAVSVGAYCRIGVIGVSAPVPLDEVVDLPCSECIKKMLRWTPDAVAFMDYATMPPTFNVVRRGDCAALGIPFAGTAESVEIKALPDLLAPAVVFRYLQMNKTDGTPSINVIVDDYPTGSDGREYGALVQTARLAGTDATYQKVAVKVQPIPTDDSSGDDGGPADDPTLLWWTRKVPWLQQFSPDRLSITGVTGIFDATQTDSDESGNNISTYPNELLSGTIAAWMNVMAAATTWNAQVTYNYPDAPDAESDRALKVFGPSQDSDNNSPGIYVAAHARATDAVTQEYAQLSSYTQAESAPTGLAQVLYDAVSILQYEGSYTVVGAEVGYFSLGMVLNLIGGRPEWENMNALLQEIEDDLDNGRTTLKFGPAGHLTLQDMMEQLRGNRSRTVSTHIKERQSGLPGDAPLVEGSTDSATGGSTTMPVVGQPDWYDYINDQNAGDNNSPPATWDVLVGYGQSSFAGEDEIDHAGPIEKLEISVGNDGSGWGGTAHDASSLYSLFSMVSGDDTASNDWLWIGRTDSAGNGGSIRLSPYDQTTSAPYLRLSPNLDPGDDAMDDQYIHIDLGNLLVQVQDSSGNFGNIDVVNQQIITEDSNGSYVSMVTAGSPYLEVFNSATENYSQLNENNLVLEDVESGGSVEIDAAVVDGASISFQQITVCVDGTPTPYWFLCGPVTS